MGVIGATLLSLEAAPQPQSIPLPSNPSSWPGWALVYEEDFSTPTNAELTSWLPDETFAPFDTILDDRGVWYQNDYGPAWQTAFDSFDTYRREFTVGQDGWLTVSLSARDWNRDGTIESPPSFRTAPLGDDHVAVLDVPDHTGGVIIRSTDPLPPYYRVQYSLRTLDFGGQRAGSIEYDGRLNGYARDGCKTQHPWGEGSRTPGWGGDASAPLCDWQSVREGPYAYNGFHFLAIVDVLDPVPRNNHFWHLRRKVLMDAFSQHPDRVGDGTGGRVCNAATGSYYDYKDSSFNTLNMWINGLPDWTPAPGGLPANSQWFMTPCSNGVAEPVLSSAAELQPELMPGESYRFAIERTETGYTLEASGNFARIGRRSIRLHRPFVVDEVPIWHYNVEATQYDGRFDGTLMQQDAFGSARWEQLWPAGSAYPEHFIIGDPYTNAYEGRASLTDIRLYIRTPATTRD